MICLNCGEFGQKNDGSCCTKCKKDVYGEAENE